MYYFYDKINQAHCPLYGGSPYLSLLSKVPLYTQYRDYATGLDVYYTCMYYNNTGSNLRARRPEAPLMC